MKRVRHYRNLALHEKNIAQSVFKNTIPYDQVVVSDGLGKGDRPFTMPTSMPTSVLFNVGEGKYVIHAGDGYYGMSYRQDDKELLIHELTHVWQGEHSASSWDYVFSSAWVQTLSDDAYAYDDRNWQEWDNYNPEQQANIVEDWFSNGMHEKEEEDLRFYYIKKHIRGESMDHNWVSASKVVRPLPSAELVVDPEYYASYLVSLLRPRFHADDVAGFRGRASKVEEFFKGMPVADAKKLLGRLEARPDGDEAARYFREHLATATRDRLTEILRAK